MAMAISMLKAVAVMGIEPPEPETPILSCPPCITLLCDNDTHPNNLGWPVINCEECDNAVITYTDQISGTCPKILTRTFKVNCPMSGMATCEQTITLIDMEDPEIDVQAKDKTVECDGNGNTADLQAWLDSQGGASASDMCGPVTWSNDFNGLSDDCGETGSASVTFTASDNCGNDVSTTATFTIEDTTPPTAICKDITIQLDENGDALITTDMVDNGSTDVCSGGATLISVVPNTFDESDCGQTITVTLTVEDDCGLRSTCTADVKVECYDLALRKTLAAGEDVRVYPGEDITFDIEITNQGTITATSVELVDYIPTGLSLNDGSWTPAGVGMATKILPGGALAPGETRTTSITFTVTQTTQGQIINRAEIKGSTTPGAVCTG